MASTQLKSTGPRLAALLAAFVIGVVSYTLVQPATIVISDIPTAAEKQKDEIHRLYEAAMLSGDDDLRNGITHRLMCADAYNSFQMQFGQTQLSLVCQITDKDLELGMMALRKSHESWVLRNMTFIRKISTAEKARTYFTEHQHLI